MWPRNIPNLYTCGCIQLKLNWTYWPLYGFDLHIKVCSYVLLLDIYCGLHMKIEIFLINVIGFLQQGNTNYWPVVNCLELIDSWTSYCGNTFGYNIWVSLSRKCNRIVFLMYVKLIDFIYCIVTVFQSPQSIFLWTLRCFNHLHGFQLQDECFINDVSSVGV